MTTSTDTAKIADVRVTKPLIDMAWIVIESAKDAGITEVVAACRRAIEARRIAGRITRADRALIIESYEGL